MAQQLLDAMIKAALAAADPHALVTDYLQAASLSAEKHRLISVGKAAVPMAQASHDTLGDTLKAGVVISKLPASDERVQTLPRHFTHLQASHPVPDESSVQATAAVRALLVGNSAENPILCLISGGASALLTEPQIPLPHWQAVNAALLRCGCTINDINLIRQHVDAVKGGGLLRWAGPAKVITLILSDVIGNNLAHIGSGPTVPTSYDVHAVNDVLQRYAVRRFLSAETQTILDTHLQALTTKPPRPAQTHHNVIIGDVKRSAQAAAQTAQAHGYKASVIATNLTGEARDVGKQLAAKLIAMPPGTCHIYGGETTVTFAKTAEQATGIGGRNQELALAAAVALNGHDNCWLTTLATDGEDGPNDGAGAIVNGQTLPQAAAQGLTAQDYLKHHDSYTFFSQLNASHLRIGSTGTNVNDITILLKPHGEA